MNDRISEHPGRVTLTPVAGQENTYDMVRADQPTQEGTPLNKATLLSDRTAISLGLTSEDPTVDDALNAAYGKVGDVKVTRRTDLGDEWRLCNGESFKKADYPDLWPVFGTLEAYTETPEGGPSSMVITCVFYSDGYWVAGGYRYDEDGCAAFILYATDLCGPWTIKDIWTGSGILTKINCITRYKGYWVIGGTYAQAARILYATDIAGEWIEKSVWSISTTGVQSFACSPEYIVACGNQTNTNYAIISYATDLTGTWTRRTIWDHSDGNSAWCIAYGNGMWVIGGRYDDRGTIAYADNPGGTWTTKTIFDYYSNVDDHVTGIVYENGTWVAVGSYKNKTSSSQYFDAISYTTDPAGTWTKVDVYATGTALEAPRVSQVGGYWIIFNTGAYILYSESLNGPWVLAALQYGSISMSDIVQVISEGEYFIAINDKLELRVSNNIGFKNEMVLPAISLDGVYSYIKVKEAEA